MNLRSRLFLGFSAFVLSFAGAAYAATGVNPFNAARFTANAANATGAGKPAPRPLITKTLQDTPGHLLFEIDAPDVALQSVGTQGLRAACAGCMMTGRPGSPDLPVYRFDVLTGPAAPQVSVRILESQTRTVAGGIAPYPFMPTPSSMQYRPDAKQYREAEALVAKVLDARLLRGAPIRGVEVPLALWSQARKSLTLIKRLEVQIDFGAVLPHPARPLPASFRGAVKNPVGGAYLYAAKPRPLLKTAARAVQLGSSFIRFKVGDHVAENTGEDKVYAVSFDDVTRAAGDFNGIRVSSLRLYTGANDTLGRHMDTVPSAGTLHEIAMEVLDKNNNNVFDSGDSLRFFAHGTSIWIRNAAATGSIRFEFSIDPYSFENYYYLDWTDQGNPPLRLSETPTDAAVGAPRTAGLHYTHAEREAETASCDPSNHKDNETGYDWHWYWKGRCDTFEDTVIDLSGTALHSDETGVLTDLVPPGPNDTLFMGLYTFQSHSDSVFVVNYGGQGDTIPMLRNTGSPGTWFAWTGTWQGQPALGLDHVKWGGREMRFEGYTVAYNRNYVLGASPLWIFPTETGKRVSYRVQNGAGARCLAVRDGDAVRQIILDGQGGFTDSLGQDENTRYFVYRNAAALPAGAIETDGLPAAGTAVRDLLNGEKVGNGYPQYLIITSRPLLAQALQLRDFRNSSARAFQTSTAVVLVEDIYRQFSGGRLTPIAIRNFIRWAYYNWGADSPGKNALQYICLFGDGHYDYRNIRASTIPNAAPNLIPPFEFIVDGNREEVATDDFFGMLEPGDFGYSGGALDVAMGRVPVQNATEAADYVAKIQAYEDPAQAGDWRGRIVMAADDGTQHGAPGDIDPITRGHTTDSDLMGKLISANEKGTTVDKVYLLDYPMNPAFHKPEAAADLLNLINRGAVMVNYVGHGAADQWADEVLLQTNDALSRMHNEGKVGMINAFSCTVGRFESLTTQGMSEQFVKQRGVGAIGAVSASRESFPVPNITLADAFYSRAFPVDSSGDLYTVGEALRDAKNSSETSDNLNDLKYNLLGEPVLLLRKPQLRVALTQALDTIKALDCSTIKGRVEGGSGSGFVNLKIVAGSVHKTYDLPGGLVPQEVDKRGNILFERTFAYKDNAFSTEYFIPKQISFGDTNAQILVFAWDGKQELEGTTAKLGLSIQGTAQSACANDSDGRGPRIVITGCEPKETGKVDFPDRVRIALPYCLTIQVEDTTGGVLSGDGPDEGTTVEIPGVLDPYHPQVGLDSLTVKTYNLTLQKKDINPGSHLLKVSASDGYGNHSFRQLTMDVTTDSSIETVTAYNSPNPMKRHGTAFYFQTVLPAQELEYGSTTAGLPRLSYEIRIYNQTGNLVQDFQDAASGLPWDGRDRWGNLLANGVYFYKIIARQILTSADDRPDYRTLSSRRNVLVISR